MAEPEVLTRLKHALKSVRRVAGWLWDRGWAEWGAGNISVNINHLIYDSPEVEKPGVLSLLISTSGSRMRQMAKKPENQLCIVNIETGQEPVIVPIAKSYPTPVPTSELHSHVLVHETLLKYRPEHKAVLHTHPAEIIALSQSALASNEKTLNEKLCAVLPELKIYLPEGIALVPFFEPGSIELARASAQSLSGHRVAIWEKHGIMATGPDLEEAFDAVDLVVKAAKVWFMLEK